MRDRANKKGALRPEPGSAPMGMSANVGRTGTDFQWDLRIVNGLLARWRHLAGAGHPEHAKEKAKDNAKGRREAGPSFAFECGLGAIRT
ncbi:hypothetical protein [Bradyrhizobium sp. CCGB20]|uniref:hypothetical protein n=1 Tax=Bradyrhizobium sp. CCGB20 TaxID=2949633 RepID=UPI0020B24AD1|nr:hypothetical protein [Bradyrhizobium sp. CCGB20]MCP3400043.1 hypothetical protein [Bradyrhizobium sp. CCGB20]